MHYNSFIVDLLNQKITQKFQRNQNSSWILVNDAIFLDKKFIIADDWNSSIHIFDFNNGIISNEMNITLTNQPKKMVSTKDEKILYIAVGDSQDPWCSSYRDYGL